MIAEIALQKPLILPCGQERIITFDTTTKDTAKHHTKKEYLKIHTDGRYALTYSVKWIALQQSTQPLQVIVYLVTNDFQLKTIQKNVTVCTGNVINLRKKNIPFDALKGERVCIGVKNMSGVDFKINEAMLAL